MNRGHIEHSQDRSLRDIRAPVQQVDHHDHGSKALATIALIAACIALGAVAMYVILEAQLIDAKIAAGSAQAEATAKEARTTAKVTEDKLIELRDALNAKGMNIPKLDGH